MDLNEQIAHRYAEEGEPSLAGRKTIRPSRPWNLLPHVPLRQKTSPPGHDLFAVTRSFLRATGASAPALPDREGPAANQSRTFSSGTPPETPPVGFRTSEATTSRPPPGTPRARRRGVPVSRSTPTSGHGSCLAFLSNARLPDGREAGQALHRLLEAPLYRPAQSSRIPHTRSLRILILTLEPQGVEAPTRVEDNSLLSTIR